MDSEFWKKWTFNPTSFYSLLFRFYSFVSAFFSLSKNRVDKIKTCNGLNGKLDKQIPPFCKQKHVIKCLKSRLYLLSLSLSLSLTHTHTHTHYVHVSLALSLSHTHTHTHTQPPRLLSWAMNNRGKQAAPGKGKKTPKLGWRTGKDY